MVAQTIFPSTLNPNTSNHALTSSVLQNSPVKERHRYAPSPTGSLHLGNARTALLAFLHARSSDADFVLRIEDIDLPRTVERASHEILTDLKWLGIDWDEGPDVGGNFGPYVQSVRGEIYDRALAILAAKGLTYECTCSRKDILRAASAPHPGEEGPIYPGTCRNLSEEAHRQKRQEAEVLHRVPAIRISVQDAAPIAFDDAVLGPMTFNLKTQVGDFVLKRADGLFAYQLVAAVDDALMNITHVLRGADLVSSTPRQLFLMDAMNLTRPRSYAHVPLLLGADGEKLSKRLGSSTLSAMRNRGMNPRKIVAALMRSCGIDCGSEIHPKELIGRFHLSDITNVPTCLDESLLG